MSKSLRDQILAISDIQTEEVTVPEWGGLVVRMRGMSAAERDRWEEEMIQIKGKTTTINRRNARARLVVRCAVDQDGNRIFGNDDIAALGQKSAAAMDRLYEVASRLSGISDEDMEELAGNSETGQSDDSSSD